MTSMTLSLARIMQVWALPEHEFIVDKPTFQPRQQQLNDCAEAFDANATVLHARRNVAKFILVCWQDKPL